VSDVLIRLFIQQISTGIPQHSYCNIGFFSKTQQFGAFFIVIIYNRPRKAADGTANFYNRAWKFTASIADFYNTSRKLPDGTVNFYNRAWKFTGGIVNIYNRGCKRTGGVVKFYNTTRKVFGGILNFTNTTCKELRV